MRSSHAQGLVRPRLLFAAAIAIVLGGSLAAQQIIPGSNVNMVSGTKFPTGDPFLQRQNEPSLAVSTRNPLHLLAGANDYRTVDLPGPFEPLRGEKMNADAWLGLFKSFDGGRTWQSTLLPGFPQDVSAAGLASPIKGRQAATDGVVKSGTNGLFYYAGLAFDRGTNAPSTVFVARFIDHNNREAGDPIEYLGTKIVDSDTGTRFLDKTALAVDVPRAAATCTIPTRLDNGSIINQTIPAGNVYVAYSAFTGSGPTEQSQILFSRSTDCGNTWSGPVNLSVGNILNQNAQIAINPTNGQIWVSWRRVKSPNGLQSDGIFIARSIDGGATFSRAVRVAPVVPFDQGTSLTSFRTNAFQTMTVDAAGRLYVAWPERGHAVLRPDPVTGDSRIVVSTSTTGSTWTTPKSIETQGLGHQLMPQLTFHGGKLRMIFYDLREDVSGLFERYIDELPIITSQDNPRPPRHTMDVYIAQALPGASPTFTSVRLSDYAFGTIAGSTGIQRLQYNPPNLPLFRQGTVPFMGDYIDLAPAPPFVQGADGTWRFNTAPTNAAVSHGVWTDNRDVRPPIDGHWENYTPVMSESLGTTSLFDPRETVPPCFVGQTGMRNQNIYTAKVTEGLFVGAPGNTKPLGSFQRGFVITVENSLAEARSYRLQILNQPPGGQASFQQFSTAGAPLTVIDATVPPFSTIARTVYATSTETFAKIDVAVNEIAAPGAPVLAGGQSSLLTLNADSTTPSIQNPSIQNPSIQNPSIQNAEVYNPAITTAFLAPSIQNPSIQNPSIQNPSIQNPSIQNPELSNDAIANPSIIDPSIQNPSIQNPSIQNPSIQNPSIQNQDLVNGAIQDTSWVITNDGNTTASYAIKLLTNSPLPSTFKSQLVLHKTYKTPSAQDCLLAQQPHTDLIANITDPTFIQVTDPSIQNPSIQNPSIQNATISLAPGESANVTLRIVDPNRFDAIEFDAGAAVAPAAVAHSVNSEDAAQGITTPPIAIPMTITTATLASAAPGGAYSASLATFASTGTTSWSVTQGSLPPGITLDPATGQLSGTPTTPGNYVFTVQVVDANGNVDVQTLAIKIDPVVPGGFSRVWNGADNNWNNPKNWSPAGVPTATDDVYVSASIAVIPTLTSDVTIHNIVVEDGATVDTNGFTLTLTGNGNAGNTIIGTGTVVMTGVGVIALGTFPNLTIAGEVLVAGPLTATGNLTLLPGAGLSLNGFAVTVGGQLVTDVPSGLAPRILSDGLAALNVGGLDVNGLTLVHVPLVVNGGALTQFDNVRFTDYEPEDDHITLNHPGTATPFAMSGLTFFTVSTTGHYVQATDTTNDGQPLVLNVSASMPGDGSSRSTTQGGAVVNWLFDPASASVGITQYVDPNNAIVGQPLTYTMLVANGGPATATNVVLNNPLPAGVSFVSAGASQGTCSFASNTVSCSLGNISPNQTVFVTLVVTPQVAGSINNAVTVTATESDPGTSDNAQTINTPVFATSATADLSITKTDSMDPVPAGSPFSYTLRVSNAGPSTAPTVLVIDQLPAGVIATSASATKGICATANGSVTCQVGSLAVGEQTTITINVTSPASFGVVTNTAFTFSTVPDANEANNGVIETTVVGTVQGCVAATFRGPFTYGGPAGAATQVQLADMDGDGDLDIVATHQGSANAVSVLPNNGDGTYGTAIVNFIGTAAFVGKIADFNGDGDLDMVVGGGGTPNTLRVLLGNGTGTLTQSGSAIPISNGFFVESLDADGDGDQDVVTRGTGNDLVLLKNNGAGAFAAPVSVYSGAVGLRSAIGDYNEDGKPDIVLARTDANFTLLLGDGAGAFTASGDFAVASVPRNIYALGDLNGDGHLDIGIAEGNSANGNAQLRLRFGTGAGSFGPAVDVSPGTTGNITVSADINGDGKPDLVTNHGPLTTVSVQLGNGSGGFGTPGYFATTAFSGPTVGDVDGDGKPDIVSGDEDGVLGVLLNNCGRPTTDLGVTVAESADPVNENDEFAYTLTVTNHSGNAATNVQIATVIVTAINSTVPPNATVTSTTTGIGGSLFSDPSDGVYFWQFPTVAGNSSFTIEFRVRALSGGTVRLTSTASADIADTDATNNTAFESTTVNATGLDLLVTNTDDSGPGSLRQAILDSNGDSADVDRIKFNIPGSGTHTIIPLSALPNISQPVVIDGTTQPGFTGPPLIELNGNGLTANGLNITGGGTTVRGLVINRFAGNPGIRIQTAGGNLILGNFIGTDVTGTAARPNGGGGIFITSANNITGGASAADRNVVSGNTGTGIGMNGATATNNLVIGNFVGTDVTGTVAIPNAGIGINISGGAFANTIGGTTSGARNVISGNTTNGVRMEGTGSINNVVQGNYIGLNAAGSAALPNSTGVSVVVGPNTIGSIGAGGNIISGNAFNGIVVSGTAASGVVVQHNVIGLNAAGNPLSNGTGVQIGAAGNTIGGNSADAFNIISGNVTGILVAGTGSTNNTIAGNIIGTDLPGFPGRANGRGIVVQNGANGNTIGGTSAAARNIISGNTNEGILIDGSGVSAITVQGNYVGTNGAGTAAVANSSHGIALTNGTHNNLIGGTASGSANVTSGNGAYGIALLGGATQNLVQGNLAGTNAAGTAAIPNGLSGVGVVNANNNTIGGTVAAARNLFSGNMFNGVFMAGATATLVRGNYIGTDATGTSPLPNGIGITMDGSGNVAGGTTAAERNVIAFNAGAGVRVTSGQNSVLGNAVYSNGALGIDLGAATGVTPNDAGDGDIGANNLQNFPVITSATAGDNVTNIQGTLNSGANATYRLEFFSNTTCDPSGNGEGQTFVGATTVATNGGGTATFSVSVLPAGNVTATATDAAGNTSEFSTCATVTGFDSLLVIPNRGLNALQVFDPASRTIVRTIPLPAPYSYTAGGTMLAAALVRPDGSILTNVRNGSAAATALKISSTGVTLAAQTSGAEFLQQIAFDPADPNREAVIGGTPFLPEVRAVNPAASTSTTRISRAGANFIGIVTAANGDIYAGAFCGPDNGAVLRYDSSGNLLGTFAQVGTATGSCEVNGLARDDAGNVYVAQNGSNRIARFDSAGTFVSFITSPSFNAPAQVFFNPQDGLLYVGNDADDRLTILTPQGTTIADVRMGGTGIGVPGTLAGTNAPPVANAGADQVVPLASVVQLDGTGSSDPENQVLTYTWILNTKPATSTAVLSATNLPNPTFIADKAGTYVAQLVVNDGFINSPSDTVTITTQNQAPIANAGADQSNVAIGATVNLNGSASSDPDGQTITYAWSFISRPASSTTTLFNATTATPSFVIDRAGLYRLQLVVSDGQTSSVPDTVDIVTVNQAPTASAGADQNVLVGSTVQLAGNGSSDPDQNPLTYSWTLPVRPAGSTATLTNATAVNPTFVPDLAGTYTARLVVNDGFVNSGPDDVTITATTNNISMALVGTPLVGVGRTATLQVTLPTAAPAGGTLVTVASDNPNVVTVGPPNTATIAQGAFTAQLTLNGINNGTATLSASAPGYAGGTFVVSVTTNVLTTPATLNVPFGQTASFPVNIPQAAPAGGVLVNLVSSDSAAVEVLTPTVTIPAAALSANGTVRGLGIGTATVTATNPSFSTASAQVSSTGALNILQTSVTYTAAFTTSVTIQLESGGTPVAAPQGGVAVTLTPTNSACVSVAGPVTIPQGLTSVTATLGYGGSATRPCSTTVTASAPSLTADTVNVTVDPDPSISVNSSGTTIGAGLQNGRWTANLGVSNHGGVTVRIASSNPAVAVVAPDAITPGTAFIDVPVANLDMAANYYLQGVEGATGTVTITASAPGFTDGSGSLTIVPAALRIEGVPVTTTSLSADAAFIVRLGTATAGNANLNQILPVRAGGSVTVTVTNSNATVARLTTIAGSAQIRTVTIGPNQSNSPTSVAAGGIAFDPLAGGTTTVSATAPGFISTTAASAQASVTTPGITVNSNTATIGAGLQNGLWTATLGGSNHGGVTMRIASSNPAVALVAPNATTPGTAFIDVPVANLNTGANYYLQGVEGATGTVTITASAPGFSDGTGSLTIVPAALRIEGVPTTTTSLSADSAFFVRIGTATGDNSNLSQILPVRAGGSVTVAITNSNAAVGRLTTLAGSAQTRTVTIGSNQSNSPTTVASGGIAFDPLAGGTTTVSASAPGFIATTAASTQVSVTAPGITVNSNAATIGAGLQNGLWTASLGGSNHGGVTMRIASSNPAVALVAPDATTPGTAFIDVPIANLNTSANYYLQGAEGATGTVTITASAPGFTDGSGSLTIVPTALRIEGVPTTTTSLSADEAFFVRIGTATAGNTNLSQILPVRAGGSVTVTVTNSNATVGRLTTLSGSAQTRTVTIGPNQSNSPTTVSTGGVAFDPLAGGTTTVSATASGVVTTTAGSAQVSVTAPGITVNSNGTTIGAGLQNGLWTAALGGSNHGGVTMRIASSNPAVALVSPDATTLGTAFIDVPVANLNTAATYYLQGVEGATGTVTITASAPGFTDGTGTLTIVPAALRVEGVPASTTSLSSDDAFFIRIGTATAGNANLNQILPVRAGSSVTVTLTNSNAAVARLTTLAGSAQTRTVTIGPNQSNSPTTVASGGVAFDPLAQGTTIVSATAPGVVSTGAGSTQVSVTAPGITLNSTGATIGAGLQDGQWAATLGGSNHGGVTVRIASSNPAVALVAPNATTPGTAFIDVPVANLSTSASYYLQGVEGATGTVTITASAPQFNNGTGSLNIVQPALRIEGVPASIDATGANAAFFIRIGLPNVNNSNLQAFQSIRAGSTGSVSISLTHSPVNVVASQLVTQSGGAQTANVAIGANQSNSPTTVATGGVAFDPLQAGSSTVSATMPNFITTDAGTVTVQVTSSFAAASTTSKPPKKKGGG